MDNPADGAPPLVAAPRHLRRRRLHGEIPDALLVPGAEPFPLSGERPATDEVPATGERPATDESPATDEVPATAKRAAELDIDDDEAAYGRKRLVALLAVIFVAASVPALILVLLLLG